MFLEFLTKLKFFRWISYKFLDKRAREMVSSIEQYLKKGNKILDLGCGSCNISEILIKKGYGVVPVDVSDVSVVDSVKPVIYDGAHLPYVADEFDVVLVLTVLHHTKDPESVLLEAARVGKTIIIIEDIYKSGLGKFFTMFMDSVLNFEFFGHPHTNKTDKEWRSLFDKHKFIIRDAKYNRDFFGISHSVYFIEKPIL